MIRRLRFGRRWLVASVLAFAVVAVGGAYAGHQDSNVMSYTGCLNISGDSAGNVLRIKAGDSPLKPCGSGQVQIHLSGGDITSLSVSAPLTGGGTNGAVSIGLSESATLPSCSSTDQVPKWNNTTGRWTCGEDNDTTYTAGTGLDLSTTEFSVEPGFRLPQSCGNGQVAKSDGSGTWGCANDADSGFPPALEAEADGNVDIDPPATVLSKTIPVSGAYMIVGKVVLANGDDDFQTSWCQLRVNDASIIDESAERNAPTDPGASPGTIDPDGTIALVEVINLGAGDVVSVFCGGFDHYAQHRQIAILRVGSFS
jgi:hypothetical protein